jgi:hypothetical protein
MASLILQVIDCQRVIWVTAQDFSEQARFCFPSQAEIVPSG